MEPYFSGFSIGSPYIKYEISVGIASASEQNPSYDSQILTISNNERVKKSIDTELKVELIGDLALA